jgi:hypothetical protein
MYLAITKFSDSSLAASTPPWDSIGDAKVE